MASLNTRTRISRCAGMEWSREDIEQLLQLYRMQPCLWDPSNPFYKARGKKAEAWAAIAAALGTDRTEVRRKMESLLACFRRERILLERGEPRARGGAWAHFRSMAFLLDRWKNAPPPPRAPTAADEAYAADENGRECSPDLFITLDQSGNDPLDVGDGFGEEDSIILEPDIPTEGLKRKSENEADVEEVLKVLKGNGAISLGRDECAVFGEFIACKLRGYSHEARSTVQHLISNVLFEADMGKYDNTAHVQLHANSSQALH